MTDTAGSDPEPGRPVTKLRRRVRMTFGLAITQTIWLQQATFLTPPLATLDKIRFWEYSPILGDRIGLGLGDETFRQSADGNQGEGRERLRRDVAVRTLTSCYNEHNYFL